MTEDEKKRLEDAIKRVAEKVAEGFAQHVLRKALADKDHVTLRYKDMGIIVPRVEVESVISAIKDDMAEATSHLPIIKADVELFYTQSRQGALNEDDAQKMMLGIIILKAWDFIEGRDILVPNGVTQ